MSLNEVIWMNDDRAELVAVLTARSACLFFCSDCLWIQKRLILNLLEFRRVYILYLMCKLISDELGWVLIKLTALKESVKMMISWRWCSDVR